MKPPILEWIEPLPFENEVRLAPEYGSTERRTLRKEPTLARTKSLIAAAYRVWELKNGYR